MRLDNIYTGHQNLVFGKVLDISWDTSRGMMAKPGLTTRQ